MKKRRWTKMDLSKFIIPKRISNTDQNQNGGNPAFDTTDYVYIQKFEDVQDKGLKQRRVSATDYAVANGAYVSDSYETIEGKHSSPSWLRSAGSAYYVDDVFSVDIVNHDGYNFCSNVNLAWRAVRPASQLNLSSIISARSASKENFKIGVVRDPDGRELCHTIEFGEYPKSRAQNSNELERAYKNGLIRGTGKSYSGYLENGKPVENKEFEYNGKKYVRVKIQTEAANYADGSSIPTSGDYEWFEVEPIVWEIENWDEMPKSINPNGSGTAKVMEVVTHECVMGGIPFYPNALDKNRSMWQNSCIRGALNGINVENIRSNGNPEYSAPNGGDWTGQGFLQQAFNDPEIVVEQNDEFAPKQSRPNPYGFDYSDLTNDELLKMYVGSNVAIFLHGTSGVGKSARVKQLDPTATRITLRPQMNPEEVDGTLDRETGKYIPPLWYVQLMEKCKAEPNRKHILFIDELTNVKPTVQSLVYSIVLDRAGKDGLWPLPENAVVVAAGNENADNLAAYPMTNALFRRFSHIYYEVDKEDWLDWATGIRKIQQQEHVENKNDQRARIHPAIVAYIKSRGESVLNQDLDEENPQIVTDPRKWEIASNVLYTTKNPNALICAIGEELTADFVDFVQSIPLSVEDVVNGNYNKSEFAEMDISERYATILGLCVAEEKDLCKVRTFINATMGKEILATYDLLWIRNDPDRALIIADSELNLEEEKDNGPRV